MAKRLLQRWEVWVAIALFCAEAALQVSGYQNLALAIFLGAGCLAALAVGLLQWAKEERDSIGAKTPYLRDRWLCDAIWFIWSGRDWGKPAAVQRNGVGLKPEDIRRIQSIAARELRQAAFEGAIPIWGKRQKSDLWEPIDPKFWETNQVNYLFAFESPELLRTEIRVNSQGLGIPLPWRELQTSRAAVEKKWPERTTPKPTLTHAKLPTPDVRLEEAVQFVESRKLSNRNAEGELRDALSLDQVHAWARTIPSAPSRDLVPPLAKVPFDTWATNTFYVMKPENRKPISRILPSKAQWNLATHEDVWLSSLELERRWPEKKV